MAILEAFLAYWLSWFIFSSGLEDGLNDFVFPLTLHLAGGRKVAPSANLSGVSIPAFGQAYNEFDAVIRALRRRITRTFCLCADVPIGAFGAIAPVPFEYSIIVPRGTGVVSTTKSIYRDCALQWAGRKQSAGKSLVAVIDIEENFNSRPYVCIPTRTIQSNFSKMQFRDTLVPRSLVPTKAQPFLGVIALTTGVLVGV